MRHYWTVLCKEIRIDEKSNNISLIDVVEQLQVKAYVEAIQDLAKQNQAKALIGFFNSLPNLSERRLETLLVL